MKTVPLNFHSDYISFGRGTGHNRLNGYQSGAGARNSFWEVRGYYANLSGNESSGLMLDAYMRNYRDGTGNGSRDFWEGPPYEVPQTEKFPPMRQAGRRRRSVRALL